MCAASRFRGSTGCGSARPHERTSAACGGRNLFECTGRLRVARRTARWDGVGNRAAAGAPPAKKKWESADKPGSVEDNHPSGTHVTVRLERPTRKPLRAAGTDPMVRALPYLVLLQVGFAVPPRVATGAVRSYRTVSPLPAGCSSRRGAADIGGLLSVALSVGSRPPGVTWHLALWSPDFPPRRETQRLPGRLPRPL
jgi:hypothetical protein